MFSLSSMFFIHCWWYRGAYVQCDQVIRKGYGKLWFLNFKIFVLPDHNREGSPPTPPPNCLFLAVHVAAVLGRQVYMRTNGYSGTGLACSCCRWCPCGNSRPCAEQAENTTLCLFLWAVTADQSRKRQGVWFSANANATAVWLANGFCLVAWTWPKKEASAIFAWLRMMFQPTSAQMHAYFTYFLASTFKNNHTNIFQSTSSRCELYLVSGSISLPFLSHAMTCRMKACM